MKNVILTILFSVGVLILWGCIALIICFADILVPFWHFNYRSVSVIFLFIILNFAVIIIFKKKLNKIWKYPLCLIISSFVLSVLIFVAVCGGYKYYGTFSPDKWRNNVDCRYMMIDNMQKKYKIVGMSKQEIIDLLGKPQNILENPIRYEYLVGYSIIDSIIYEIYFNEDTVSNTNISER